MRLLAAALAAVALAPSAGAAVSGEQRVLLLHVTWGPEPWTVEHARTSLNEASAYIRSASFGRTWVAGEVTPWLHALPGPPPDGCDIRRVEAAANAAAAAAGYELSRYTKQGYAFPQIGCPWAGAYFSPGIWMNDAMNRHVLAHELGHTYGITEEGPAWACEAGGCRAFDYASPYSVMGHGLADYNAFEKLTYGWLDRVARPRGNADVAIGAIDRPSADPHALHVLTASEEYWLELRPEAPLWPAGVPAATPGVVVHAGTNGLTSRSRFPQRNLLLLDPVGAGRPSLVAGQTFSVPGAFAVTVTSTQAARATLRFRWTDATRPSPPRIERVGRRSLAWAAARDGGSGVSAYEVRIDARRVRRLPAVQIAGTLYLHGPRELRYTALRRGRHRVAVVAVDRAGNRSAPATRTFLVR